jgi:hypothetical protein
MPNFILAFRGGMPKSPEEGQKMMSDWNAWVASVGSAMVDKGAGFGKSRFLTGRGVEGKIDGALSGYTIITANDIDAAVALAAKNPIFDLGGTIEIAEAMQM